MSVKERKKIKEYRISKRLISLCTVIVMLLMIMSPIGISQAFAVEEGDLRYTSDWDLKGKDVTEEDTSIIQTGITFDRIETAPDNSTSTIRGSMYYRAASSPRPTQMWIYFRIDPKLKPYLPDDFEMWCNALPVRFVQLVKEDMVGTPKIWFNTLGNPYGPDDPYLNSEEPVYRIFLDTFPERVAKSGNDRLEKGALSGNWGVFPNVPIESIKHRAHFKIQLKKSWEEIKKETGQDEFTLDMRIQGARGNKDNYQFVVASESLKSATVIKDVDYETEDAASLWLASNSYIDVDYNYEGKIMGADKTMQDSLKDTGKTLVRAKQVWPHGGSSYTGIGLSTKPWVYKFRVDPLLLKKVAPGDKIVVWAAFSVNNFENGAHYTPMFISPLQFNDDGTIICTSDETKDGVKGYAYSGTGNTGPYIAREASSPFVSATIVDIPVKFDDELLNDDGGYRSFSFDGEMRTKDDVLVKDTYANTYMNLYGVKLDYRGLKPDTEYNPEDTATYDQLDEDKFPGKIREIYHLDDYKRDFEGYHFVEAKSGPAEATVDRTTVPHFIYVYDKNVKPADPDTPPEEGYARVVFRTNDENIGKVSLKNDGNDLQKEIAFDVWPGTEFSAIPEVFTKAEKTYYFDGWNPVLPDGATVIQEGQPYTYTAQFVKGVIGPVDPNTPKPSDRYYEVTYNNGDHGSFTESSFKYFVYDQVDITFGDLTAPSITADEGYKFMGWDKADDLKIDRDIIATALYKDKIIVPVDPDNPGEVPDGYNRITFDALDGKIGDKQKLVIDVLDGTLWDDSNLTAVMPKSAVPNDNTKEFDKWNPEVPANGKVATSTFEAAYKAKDKIIVPVDPDNPGEVPDGYNRIIFDALDGKIGDKQKLVIDVLDGTLWDDSNLTAVMPKSAVPNDNTKEFDKWNPEVPATGKVTTSIFEAAYKAKDKIIVPVDPDNPGEVPEGYNRIIFDALDGKIGDKQKKVIDVLDGTQWDDSDLTAVMPKSAVPNDNTKEFDKWNPEVPSTGKVTTSTFEAAYKSKDKIIVPVDPDNPGEVPDGYNRIIFDALDGKIGDKQKKVIDVLEGTEWNDSDLTAVMPKNAVPNDNTKEFDKWNPEVPANGKVATSTFEAAYKAKDKIIVPVDPDNPGEVPDGYNRIIFDALDGKIGNNQKLVIDVLDGTEWDDSDLVTLIPKNSFPNDETKDFDKWTPDVPAEGKVENSVFEAAYKEREKEKSAPPVINPIEDIDYEITGTGIPESTVEVTVPGHDPVTVIVDENGNWRTEFDKPLPKGTEVSATQTEPGKTVSDPFEITVTGHKTEKSEPPVIDPIKDTDKEITGNGIPGAEVEVTVPGEDPVTVIVDENGKWKVELDKTLPEGTIVNANQTEPGKNKSDSVSTVVTGDKDTSEGDKADGDNKNPENENGNGNDKTTSENGSKVKENVTDVISKTPKTGDESKIWIYVIIVAAALTAFYFIRRKRTEEK